MTGIGIVGFRIVENIIVIFGALEQAIEILGQRVFAAFGFVGRIEILCFVSHVPSP